MSRLGITTDMRAYSLPICHFYALSQTCKITRIWIMRKRIGRLMRHTCLHVVSCGDKGKKALNSNIAEEKFDFV